MYLLREREIGRSEALRKKQGVLRLSEKGRTKKVGGHMQK